MNLYLKNLKDRHAQILKDYHFLRSTLFGLIFLAVSLFIMHLSSLYAYERSSSSVSDIILNNIPTFDVDWIFVYGPVIFTFIIIFFSIHRPRVIPFTVKSIALFVIIRSLFITLTHIAPFPDQTVIDSGTKFLQALSDNPNFFLLSNGYDLFFSGHTGLPFMLGLVFWKNTLIRYICMITSVFFAIIVLLGHLHYSIDVASAFFISYTIYIIATKIFKRDHAWFMSGISKS